MVTAHSGGGCSGVATCLDPPAMLPSTQVAPIHLNVLLTPTPYALCIVLRVVGRKENCVQHHAWASIAVWHGGMLSTSMP